MQIDTFAVQIAYEPLLVETDSYRAVHSLRPDTSDPSRRTGAFAGRLRNQPPFDEKKSVAA